MDKTIDKLLKGTMKNVTRCKHVDFSSERSEVFVDIQMFVSGCKNLYDSFDKLTEVRSAWLQPFLSLRVNNSYDSFDKLTEVRSASL